MCIFSGKVKKVCDTKILVYETTNGKQVTFYENSVHPDKNVGTNAMILPCPFNGNDEIKLYNLEEYPNLFDDCSKCFPLIQNKQNILRKHAGAGVYASASLEVVDVGGYKVSIAKNLDDVLKIDKTVFILPDNIAKLLSKHYSQGFAFIICVFANKQIKNHPIAYEHSKLKSSELFAPTRHAHGGEHEPEHAKADFHHIIYSVNTVNRSIDGVGSIEESERAEKLKDDKNYLVTPAKVLPSSIFDKLTKLDVSVPKPHSKLSEFDLRKEVIDGMYKNEDFIYSLA